MLSGVFVKVVEWFDQKIEYEESGELKEDYTVLDTFESATSNEVSLVKNEKGEEYVLKELEGFSKSQLLEMVSGLIFVGELDYPDVDQCLENEEGLRKKIGRYLNLAEIIEKDGTAFVMEKVDSIPYKEWAKDADTSDFRSVTRSFMEDYSELLEEGYSVRDARLSNLAVTPDLDIDYCWFDIEYAEVNSSPEAQRIDKLQMLESAKHLSPEMYQNFRQVFDEVIGEVDEEIELASDLASIGHSFPYSLSDIEEQAGLPTGEVELSEFMERLRNEALGYESEEEWYQNALQNAEYSDEEADAFLSLMDETLKGYVENVREGFWPVKA
ncbi:MAG: hypothetical protein ABEJ56_03175 [Candidatus Nanohaloarchaea archaeon]